MTCQVRQKDFDILGMCCFVFLFFLNLVRCSLLSLTNFHLANNDILKLDPSPVWETNPGHVRRFGFKCQSSDAEAEQTLALCELDTNWTPELGVTMGELSVNQH